MVTIDLDFFDRKTEVAITRTKSDLTMEEAEKIVDIIRGLRETEAYDFAPTIRGCIMVAKAIKASGAQVISTDLVFRQICEDVLSSETSRLGEKTTQEKVRKIVSELINRYCGASERKRNVGGIKPLKIPKMKKEKGSHFRLKELEKIGSY